MKLKLKKTSSTTQSFNRTKLLGALLAAAPMFASLPATAQDPGLDDAAMAKSEAPFVTGTLVLAIDTHFVSYGADVWGAGSRWKDALFHPSLELNFDLGKGFKGIAGIWMDVNNNTETTIGQKVTQEVDVWVGLSYGYKEWTFTALYQEWMYASQNERIVDLKVAYDYWLNPSATLHCRVANGLDNTDIENGVVGVLGVAPGTSWKDISFSFPVNVAFQSNEFQEDGDAGFSYASAGANLSIPLKFIPKGDWTFGAGLTYFYTSDDAIPGNKNSCFLTGTTSIALAF